MRGIRQLIGGEDRAARKDRPAYQLGLAGVQQVVQASVRKSDGLAEGLAAYCVEREPACAVVSVRPELLRDGACHPMGPRLLGVLDAEPGDGSQQSSTMAQGHLLDVVADLAPIIHGLVDYDVVDPDLEET